VDLSSFEGMEAPELRRYLEFLLWHYSVVDGFWFLFTEERYGRTEAESVNEKVWERISGIAARDLIKRFDIRERGLEAFAKLLRLYPWSILLQYEIEERPGEVVVTVPTCATQEARRRRGLPEYECREMHRREFTQLALAVDQDIQVFCEFAPTGERPSGLDCRWRFTLARGKPAAPSRRLPA
jgi:hypothetical protein